ncbi:MAG: Helix-turn-helix domain [Verrucomicrobiota bacterium]|jgi:excisionase family DNA binding protein
MATTHEALLNRKDAGSILHVSLRTIDELISTGDLPVVRLGRSVRIRPSALDYLIEARETRANPRKKGGAK